MSGPITIQSAGQWQDILSTTNVVVADFYADWCGPCKMIAPHFETLSKEHSKPKKVAFCKINVDSLSSVSRTYGVTAMPTFIIFHAGQPIETIRGANPPALTGAISKAVNLPAKPGHGAGHAFQAPGRTLGGGEGVGSSRTVRPSAAASAGFSIWAVIQHVVTVVGLYVVSLIAVRWYLFGMPEGGLWAMLTDWWPNMESIDRFLQSRGKLAV
ncbi:thioredoxin-like protein [Sodiomyces alkalinus F11]|uniref:Thioredoxin-like protein n=1 Tax=Sodiomyces alkalinus (strain CBS 110278 / VKM F-3762 / F11) TaxID=1314773 RepID=A0A3N2Q2X9_SODAK|nr:thioredoxin-like protein [Sodiomyces alkalinus F11]ROT41092.1 thioredoxin-like protein [Sodiomyces alkalinus F11]